jgi:hypothetical protein
MASRGLALLLDETIPSFACVSSACPFGSSDENREWLLARWALQLDDDSGPACPEEECSSDERSVESDEHNAGMHLIMGLLDRRLAVVRKRAIRLHGEGSGREGASRRGPAVRIGMDVKRVFGGTMKVPCVRALHSLLRTQERRAHLNNTSIFCMRSFVAYKSASLYACMHENVAQFG